MSATKFNGFSEPSENYYRLPNDWFDTVCYVLRETFGERFASPLKLLEYVLKHTWGYGRFDGQVRLTAREIASGRMKNGRKIDYGTGLSENSITSASRVLEKIGVLEIIYSQDKARAIRTFRPRMKSEDIQDTEQDAQTDTPGFTRPTENYFKVPMAWTDMASGTGSAACIVAVEYFFRHGWGYHNPNGLWLDADDVAYGRRYKNSERRYDQGIGFELSTTYRALNEAVKRGFLVWAEVCDNYQNKRVFNLRLDGMPVGEDGMFLGQLPWEDDASAENSEAAICTDEGGICIVEDTICTDEEGICTVEGGIGTNEVRGVCIDEEPIGIVEDGICIDAEGIRTNEDVICTDAARTVEPYTLKDTSDQYFKSTLPTTSKQPKSKEEGDSAQNVDGGAVIQKESFELPVAIQKKLIALEWADTSNLLQETWQHDPDLVDAWLNFALSMPDKAVRKSRAGLFRSGLLSKKLPPYRVDHVPEHKLKPPEEISSWDDTDIGDVLQDEGLDYPWPEDKALHRKWQAALGQLQIQMSRQTFETYLRDTIAVSFDDETGEFAIGVLNAYSRKWLEERLSSTVSRLMSGILNRTVDAKFICPEVL